MSKSFWASVSVAALVFAIQGGIPAYAGDQVPPKVNVTSPTGVSLTEGTWSNDTTDISIGPLQLDRFIVPTVIDSSTLFFGSHVSHSFDIYLARTFVPNRPFFPQHYTYVAHLGGGASGMYSNSGGTISVASTEAQKGTLKLVGSAYVYTDLSGTIYTFNPSVAAAGANKKGVDQTQRVASILYQNGRLLTFSYVGASQLKLVTDNTGYALVFDYAGNGNVSAVCGFNTTVTSVSTGTTCSGAALKATYGYTGSVLTSLTDVRGYTTNLENNSYCVKPPGYSVCKVLSNPGGPSSSVSMVTSQTFADGSVWTFNYEGDYTDVRDEAYMPAEGGYTEMIDPNGKHSYYFYTKTTINSITDANGHTTSYNFLGAPTYETINPLPNTGSQLDTITAPEGNIYKEIHGGNQLVVKRTWKAKPGSGLSDIVQDLGYNSCPGGVLSQYCTQPAWTRDAKGNQTDYTYDVTHGGMLTKTLPADQNGLRTRTYNTYETYNTGNGNIYRLIRSETCGLNAGQLTLTACPATTTTAVTVTTYYGKTFQPLTVTQTDGAGSLSATTSYDYDAYGNAISVDGPLAGSDDKSFKTYNLAHQVECEIAPDPDGAGALIRQMVRHNYDMQGQEVQTEIGTGTSTTSCLGGNMTVASFTRMTYDLVGRVIKTEVVQP